MIRMLMLLGVSVAPMLITASIIDGQNKVAQGFNEPAARRSQNVEIAPAVDDAIALSSPTAPTPDSVEPEPSFQLIIDACDNQTGNAKLRAGDDVIGVISKGTTVDLTGQTSGQWVEVSGSHWPTGESHPINGTGWIHECWLSPDSVTVVEPDPQIEPLGLLSRHRRGRSFRSSVSRPRKSYMQSTGELAGYVGRDLYDYALLSSRVGAYQSFWNFATEGPKPTYSYQSASTVPIPQPIYLPTKPSSPLSQSRRRTLSFPYKLTPFLKKGQNIPPAILWTG